MKPIAIPRPTDPELRRQWDEAKRACETRDACDRCLGRQGMHFSWCSEQPADGDPMQCCPRFSWGDGFHDISCFRNRGALRLPQVVVEAAGARVADDDCCVGDRSQCRCAPEHGGWSDEDVEREKWIAVWSDGDDETKEIK